MPIYIYKNIIKNNFEKIKKITNKIPAIVLKSNAYGLGIKNIVPILKETDCEKIFVHSIEEALEIRSICDKFQIIIFSVNENQNPKLFKSYNFLPTINRLEDIKEMDLSMKSIPWVLNVDLGMNRNGLKYKEILDNLNLLKTINIQILMGHLHITHNTPMDMINEEEKNEFDTLIQILLKENIINNNTEITLASSNVLEFGSAYIYNFPRIGKNLYGICHKNYEFEEAIKIVEKIKIVKKVLPGEIVGYNGHKVFYESYLGIIDVGYSSGISLDFIGKLDVKYKNNYYKIISISMEYTIIDFQNIKPEIGEEIILFPRGFVSECNKNNFYYLEQLLKMFNMKKIVIN